MFGCFSIASPYHPRNRALLMSFFVRENNRILRKKAMAARCETPVNTNRARCEAPQTIKLDLIFNVGRYEKMLSTDELIETLEISIKNLKAASMMAKPKHAEQCVTDALTCIKQIAATQKQQTAALVDLNKRLSDHIKTGR